MTNDSISAWSYARGRVLSRGWSHNNQSALTALLGSLLPGGCVSFRHFRGVGCCCSAGLQFCVHKSSSYPLIITQSEYLSAGLRSICGRADPANVLSSISLYQRARIDNPTDFKLLGSPPCDVWWSLGVGRITGVPFIAIWSIWKWWWWWLYLATRKHESS